MADTTTSGRSEAVKAVTGQVDRDEIKTTGDLKSEQDKNEKLDKETTKAIGGDLNPHTASGFGPKERKQRAVRTLANGKTEAVLEEAPPVPSFVPDDGGYNPERRFYAGPSETKVPSAVGKNATSGDSDLIAAGWKPDQIKDKDAK